MTNVLLKIRDAQGYAPNQVENTITLAGLREQLEDAIRMYGEDARIILEAQGRGAVYGGLSIYEELFSAEEPEADDEW